MKSFHKSIFFTKAPLGGYYKYKDVFQIYPADLEGMPKSRLQRHFPNVIEYWTVPEEKLSFSFSDDDDDDEYLAELRSLTATTITKQEKILNLLSTFTNNQFFRQANPEGIWGMPILSDDPSVDADSWESKWCWEMYFFPGMPDQLKIKEFTNQAIKPISTIQYPKYYYEYPHLDSDRTKEVALPSIISVLLDTYFSLTPTLQKSVDSAISYTVSAIELSDRRKTLSLLSSFTSLETMVNIEYDGVKVEKCEACGQPKFSVSKKFREYLLKYIGSSDTNKKKFNSFYSLRSKLVHTGRQLQTEALFAEVEKETEYSELVTRIEILQLGKLGIVNWLYHRYLSANQAK